MSRKKPHSDNQFFTFLKSSIVIIRFYDKSRIQVIIDPTLQKDDKFCDNSYVDIFSIVTIFDHHLA